MTLGCLTWANDIDHSPPFGHPKRWWLQGTLPRKNLNSGVGIIVITVPIVTPKRLTWLAGKSHFFLLGDASPRYFSWFCFIHGWFPAQMFGFPPRTFFRTEDPPIKQQVQLTRLFVLVASCWKEMNHPTVKFQGICYPKHPGMSWERDYTYIPILRMALEPSFLF